MCHQHVYVKLCMIYFSMTNVMGFSEKCKFVGRKNCDTGKTILQIVTQNKVERFTKSFYISFYKKIELPLRSVRYY